MESCVSCVVARPWIDSGYDDVVAPPPPWQISSLETLAARPTHRLPPSSEVATSTLSHIPEKKRTYFTRTTPNSKMMQRLSLLLIAAWFQTSFSFAPLKTPTLNSRLSADTTTQLSAASIQFVRGLDEGVVPDVKLTRARDGNTGIATFKFDSPQCFDASTAMQGEVTGMFMTDEEGEIKTTDVNAKFSNGKPQSIEATYVMYSPDEWDRFMRFMDRYAEANELGFNKA